MPHEFSPVVEQLIQVNMASGKYGSEDELLLEALQSLGAEEVELGAIREGLESVDRGEDGVSVEEAFAEIRTKNHLRESA